MITLVEDQPNLEDVLFLVQLTHHDYHIEALLAITGLSDAPYWACLYDWDENRTTRRGKRRVDSLTTRFSGRAVKNSWKEAYDMGDSCTFYLRAERRKQLPHLYTVVLPRVIHDYTYKHLTLYTIED